MVEGFSIREETFYLFREEYKVPLLPSGAAAYLNTVAERVFPVLLFFGLASRLSALGLFGMTMVIQLFVVPGVPAVPARSRLTIWYEMAGCRYRPWRTALKHEPLMQ